MKKIMFLLFVAIFVSTGAYAQQNNRLYIPEVVGMYGKEIALPIYVDNSSEITAFQFTLQLPEGATLNTSSAEFTNRKDDHAIAVRSVGNSKYMFVAYSPSNKGFRGESGKLLSVNMSIPETLEEGESYPMTLTDVVLSMTDGNNVVTAFEAGNLTIAKSPDLEVSNALLSVSQVVPGDKVSVSWQVSNIGGNATTAGWSEQISIVSDNDNKATLIGTLYYDATIEAGAVISRNAEIELPKLMGVDGAAKLQIKLISDSDSGERPEAQGNNTLLTDNILTVEKVLYVELPQYAIEETNSSPIRCKLLRSGSWCNDETFTLSTSIDGRIDVPSSVTIPAAQSSVFFNISVVDNNVLDDTSEITITAEGNGYESIASIITIEDNEYPMLSIFSSEVEFAEGDNFQLEISTERESATPITVTLSCDHPSRFSYPTEVVIPAGETEVLIDVTAVDDNQPDLTENIIFTVSALKYQSAEHAVYLYDNDIPQLELTFSPSSVSESAGMNAIVAKLKRLSHIDNKITIQLSDDSNNRILYSRNNFVFEKGEEEILFSMGVIDNATVDGDNQYNVTAAVYISSCNCSASGTQAGIVSETITVLDNDGPSLQVISSKSSLIEGSENGDLLTISRNTDTSEAITVTLQSDHDEDLEYQKTITIPAGQSSVKVPVAIKSNDISDDSRMVVFTVSGNGFSSATCWVMITDQTLPDAVITNLEVSPSEIISEDKAEISVTVSNQGVVELPAQAKVNIYMSNSSSPILYFYTQEALQPGESVTMTKTLKFPNLIGNYTLSAIVNESSSIKEIIAVNNSYGNVNVKLLPKFTATVSTDKTVYSQNESVLLNGVVTGKDIDNAEVEIYVINNGLRQSIIVTTDATGKFSTEWQPYSNQAGHFAVGACYPGEGLTTEQAAFDIYGLKRTSTSAIVCETLAGESYQGSIKLYNPSQLPLTNVMAEIISKPENCLIEMQIPSQISGEEYASLSYTLFNEIPSEGEDWENIKLHITTSEGVELYIPLYYYCYSQKPVLVANVPSINTTMVKGSSRNYSFVIQNNGKGETGTISIVLPNVEWIKLLTPKNIPSLAYGESAIIDLMLTPTDDMQLNVPLKGQIGINCENGNGIPLSYNIEPVSELTGTVVIDVCDGNTYNTEEAPHVSGASVVISHLYTGAIMAEGITDERGLFTANLTEGYYNIKVSSSDHDSYTNTILVDPGRETDLTINLSLKTIDFKWNMQPTEVKDEYTLVTTVKYETNVPAPVVIIKVPDNFEGEKMLDGESKLIYVTVVNEGLITAMDVTFIMPEDSEEWSFEALSSLDPFDLLPHQSVIIPISITRHLNSDPSLFRLKSVLKSNVIETAQDYFANCMAMFALKYKFYCGDELKNNKAAERMAMKACTYASAGATTLELLSKLFSNWELNLPGGDVPPSPLKDSQSKIEAEADTIQPVVTENSFSICDTCDAKKGEVYLNILISSRGPILGAIDKGISDASEIYQDARDSGDLEITKRVSLKGYENIMEALRDAQAKKLVGEAWEVIVKIIDIIEVTTKECPVRDSNITKDILKNTINRSWQEEYNLVANDLKEYIYLYNDIMIELFGDEVWFKTDNFEEKATLFAYLRENENASYEDILAMKPEDVSVEQLDNLLERIENFANSKETENTINLDSLDEMLQQTENLNNKAKEEGYNSLTDYFMSSYEVCVNKYKEMSSSENVCASISLQFSQSMVMTRQAFRGTLTVFNGHETTAMEDVKLILEVRDENGILATENEFQINMESLDGFSGENSLTSGWSLAANEQGVATVLFIPTKYAAPTDDMKYSFGGTLSYIDPFTGYKVTRKLSPIVMTVKPSPNLDITYFMQRDIYGDDLLTKDVIEPMLPAEFSLLINNKGYGDAKNVSLKTNQPQIIDNEKGLLIQFELLSSKLNGSEKSLSLGESVTTDFGTISAKSTAYVQWELQSTRTGHFTDYDVSVTHVTSYGNANLSLLDTVTIKELIHSVKFVGNNDISMAGFIVNEIPDEEDMPDMIYLSDGTVESVAITDNITITKNSETQFVLSVTASADGWNYGSIKDPTNGKQKIVSIVRNSDGKIIDTQNIWQTDRILRDGLDPLYENRLHFADYISSASEEYLLSFEPKPETELEVSSFSGLPADNEYLTAPIDNITVTFNKAIQSETFTTDDIKIYCEGKELDCSEVTITKISDNEYELNLSALTSDNGYYVLIVNTANIIDIEGFSGYYGKQIGWTQYLGSMVMLDVKASSEEAGEVSFESGKQLIGTTINIVASPAKGYEFVEWIKNGYKVSTDKEYQFVIDENTQLTAIFVKKSYKVSLIYDSSKGEITNGGTGIYTFGDVLNFNASVAENCVFRGWKVNDEVIELGNKLSFTVEDNTNIEALFLQNKVISEDVVMDSDQEYANVNISPEDDVKGILIDVNVHSYKAEKLIVNVDKEGKSPQITIHDSGIIKADTIEVARKIKGGVWTMLSLPFEAKIKDITVEGEPAQIGENIIIQLYDGAYRAANSVEGQTANAWIEQSNSSIIPANQGFAIAINSRGEGDVQEVVFRGFNFNMNAEDKELSLYRYISSVNRGLDADWNFLGNPTLSNQAKENGYALYLYNSDSDNYTEYSSSQPASILPFGAWFVQSADDFLSMAFRTKPSAIKNAGEDVYGSLTFNINDQDDVSLVINSESCEEYVRNEDALYMASPNSNVSQLYIIQKGINLAVSEQPFISGTIKLAYKAINAGEQTLTLTDEIENVEVTLTDNLTGEVTLMSGGDSYSFESTEGIFENRFEVNMSELTGIKQVKTSDVLSVVVTGDEIKLYGTEAGNDIVVFTVNGLQIASTVSKDGVTNINTSASGVLIIKVGTEIIKVVK